MNKKNLFLALIVVLCFYALNSLPEEPSQDKAYCEMVAIWQNDPRPEIDRAGWPPYNPNIDCGVE